MTNDIKILGNMDSRHDEILTPDALDFIAKLHVKFNQRRLELLEMRIKRQAEFNQGKLPHFLPATKHIRESDWKVALIPHDLLDRRVEITGPVSRKMIINALNSGAKVFMGDFEDATAPTWQNMLEGQINLKDLWQGKIDFTDPNNGKDYSLNDDHAVLLIRPRGWHLEEEHLTVNSEAIAGGIFDFGLYLFHNAKNQLIQNTGPYFYLPKLESHLEARLWNDIFITAQELLGLHEGTIKATVLIETLPAAFEMDEIIYELKDHMAGLNCGRWDYIFSFIKTLQADQKYILPDRSQVSMDRAFLEAYSKLLIKTCHKRGAFAMGGMAAAIPNRKDQKANDIAFENVRNDKIREAKNGHDGTWVAHPDLVPVAMDVFNEYLKGKNQLDKGCNHYEVTEEMLLEVHSGTKTQKGIEDNIRIGVQYIEAWLRGVGAVPLYNLMEDAATAEISRTQVWQLLKFKAPLEDGTAVTEDYVRELLKQEMKRIEDEIGQGNFAKGRFAEAEKLFKDLIFTDKCESFLTLSAYQIIK